MDTCSINVIYMSCLELKITMLYPYKNTRNILIAHLGKKTRQKKITQIVYQHKLEFLHVKNIMLTSSFSQQCQFLCTLCSMNDIKTDKNIQISACQASSQPANI